MEQDHSTRTAHTALHVFQSSVLAVVSVQNLRYHINLAGETLRVGGGQLSAFTRGNNVQEATGWPGQHETQNYNAQFTTDMTRRAGGEPEQHLWEIYTLDKHRKASDCPSHPSKPPLPERQQSHKRNSANTQRKDK